VTQHDSLDAARWRSFTRDQQILIIGNEMHRASRIQNPEDVASRRLAYERVLRLTDLRVEVQTGRSLRRELLRWRDLAASLYINASADPAAHAAALPALLVLTPEAAKQIPHTTR